MNLILISPFYPHAHTLQPPILPGYIQVVENQWNYGDDYFAKTCAVHIGAFS